MPVIPQSGINMEPDTGKQNKTEWKPELLEFEFKTKSSSIDSNSLFHSLSACQKCQVSLWFCLAATQISSLQKVLFLYFPTVWYKNAYRCGTVGNNCSLVQ